MKILRLFIAFLLLSLCAHAQSDTAKLIGLHPAVGKTISRDEKIKYHLFPEYSDTTFTNAQVLMYNDTTYLLQVTQTDGHLLKNMIGTSQLDDAYYHIDEIEKLKDPDYGIASAEEKQDEYKSHRKANVGKIVATVFISALDVALLMFMPRYY